MSDWPVPPEQPEAIRWKIILPAIVMTLFLFGIAVLIVGLIQTMQRGTVTDRMGQPEINELFTTPFAIETQAIQEKGRDRTRLEGWGWVSRQRGEIHIPIEDAITDVLKKSSKPPAPVRGGGR